jgi:hypothetical protein
MENVFIVKRTTSDDPAFSMLTAHLDHELWNELKEDQSTYDQFNKVPGLDTVVVIINGDVPVACGCFKAHDSRCIEIKRMFVEKAFRGKGLSWLVLKELEKWAIELGYSNAILETSIHFKIAQRLYAGAGYFYTENYGQYEGLPESVCMRKVLQPMSENCRADEEFDFEKEFVNNQLRCIPMCIRFKLDQAGIKLKLSEWSKFTVQQRNVLKEKPCASDTEMREYREFLENLVVNQDGVKPEKLASDGMPLWSDLSAVPAMITTKANQLGAYVSLMQWKGLSNLQRFALVKLSKDGHESKNFEKALREFGLLRKY